mgnify:FL=1
MGNNEWLDIDVLDDYLEGKLDPSTMHKVERISLEDPFVAQALAGLTEAKKRTQTLSLLQKQLQERIAEKPIERKMWRITSLRLSIAATAAVVFIVVSVLFLMRENQRKIQSDFAARNKTVEVDLKPEVAAVAPVDTLSKAAPETLLDQKKVTQALDNTLSKNGQAIAKNNTAVQEEAVAAAILQEKQFKSAPLKQENYQKQNTAVGPPIAAPTSPMQVLDSRVDGIQVKTDPYARSVKGTVYDVTGRPLPGADVKMVGNDIRAITNVSGEFTLPIDKDSNKVTLEVASLGFARKNVEAKANEKLNIRLEGSSSALNEVVVATEQAKRKSVMAAKEVSDEILIGVPKNGWKAYGEYLAKENKLYVDGSKTVMLNFTILPDGTPSDIKVGKSSGKDFDEEAIRLLKNGSKWNYPAGVNKTTAISIKF